MSEQQNLILRGLQLNLRFQTSKGQLTIEDLLKLPLTKSEEKKNSRVVNLEENTYPGNLNDLAKSLSKEVKELADEDFVNENTSLADEKVILAFEIVKLVIATIKAERNEKEEAAKKKARKQYLAEQIEKKKLALEEGRSLEEMEAEFASL